MSAIAGDATLADISKLIAGKTLAIADPERDPAGGRAADLLRKLGDQLAVSVKVSFAADQHCVRPLLLHRGEDALNLRGSPFLREHPNQRNSESVAGVAQADEVDALDDAARVDVEARDDTGHADH